MSVQPVSMDARRKRIKTHERIYVKEGNLYAPAMIKHYTMFIHHLISHNQYPLANQYATKVLRVFLDYQQYLMYNLVPGFDFIHMNDRMLHHMHAPVFGMMYYYLSLLIMKTKDQAGLERHVDNALAILTYKNQRLTSFYRRILLQTIELKQKITPLSHPEQIELLKRKRKLFRDRYHLYQTAKEFGDLYQSMNKPNQANKWYQKASVYTSTDGRIQLP
jgi:hypothetical protein